MTEIERKALALVNECAGQEVYGGWKTFDPNQSPCTRALCRAIEQHEAFKREVSDAMVDVDKRLEGADYSERSNTRLLVQRFILPKPKPDPLVAVMDDFMSMDAGRLEECVEQFRVALARRGLEVREIEK